MIRYIALLFSVACANAAALEVTPGTSCGQDGVGYVMRAGDTAPRLVRRTNNGADGYRVNAEGYWERCEMPKPAPRDCRLSSGYWPSWHDPRSNLTCYSTLKIEGPMAHGTEIRVTGLGARYKRPSDRVGGAVIVCNDGGVRITRYWCEPIRYSR